MKTLLPLALCLLLLLPSCVHRPGDDPGGISDTPYFPEGMSMEEFIVRLQRGEFPELREMQW